VNTDPSVEHTLLLFHVGHGLGVYSHPLALAFRGLCETSLSYRVWLAYNGRRELAFAFPNDWDAFRVEESQVILHIGKQTLLLEPYR
jgi:hypothetical protein